MRFLGTSMHVILSITERIYSLLSCAKIRVTSKFLKRTGISPKPEVNVGNTDKKILFVSLIRVPMSYTYLLTYLLTPWCRVLLEKLTGLQLVKKFPAFHGTRRFITAFISVRQMSLSWVSPIQSIYPHPTSWRSVLILSTHLHLGLPSGLLPSGLPTKNLYTPSPHPYTPHAQPISFFSILSPAQYWMSSTDHIYFYLYVKQNILNVTFYIIIHFKEWGLL